MGYPPGQAQESYFNTNTEAVAKTLTTTPTQLDHTESFVELKYKYFQDTFEGVKTNGPDLRIAHFFFLQDWRTENLFQ